MGGNNTDFIFFFFFAIGMTDHEFVRETDCKWKVIKRLITLVCHVRPEFQESGSSYFLHGNALVHSSGTVSFQ
jgi:hypothetical protein